MIKHLLLCIEIYGPIMETIYQINMPEPDPLNHMQPEKANYHI